MALCLSGAGCVIPVGPEFEGQENLSPYLVSATPSVSSIIAKPLSGDPEIRVILGDPNTADRLYVRWIFDYPTYDPNVTRVHSWPALPPSEGQRETRGPFTFAPNCFEHNIAPGKSEHRLMMAVSDRPFLDPEKAGVQRDLALTAVPEGAHLLISSWFLTDLECGR